jgi:hypothetical protein
MPREESPNAQPTERTRRLEDAIRECRELSEEVEKLIDRSSHIGCPSNEHAPPSEAQDDG